MSNGCPTGGGGVVKTPNQKLPYPYGVGYLIRPYYLGGYTR